MIREIHLCLDFRNLNRELLKDNYPLPRMDQLLHMVTGVEMVSMMDIYFGYNKVIVVEYECYKMAFTTLWGIFA